MYLKHWFIFIEIMISLLASLKVDTIAEVTSNNRDSNVPISNLNLETPNNPESHQVIKTQNGINEFPAPSSHFFFCQF